MHNQESDVRLLSSCILLGLNPESIEERAAILEYDADLSRDAANREALALAMRELDRRYTRWLAGRFFDMAWPALEAERQGGWTREKTIAWITARLRVMNASNPSPDSVRVVA